MGRGIICQCCGVEAPTKYVDFYQNIGALIMRFHKSTRGHLCKRCINQTFWKFTGVNLTLGWWGVHSLLLTPCYILNNVIRYLGCISLPAPSAGATAPQLTEEAVNRLKPYPPEIFKRLNQKEPIDSIATSIARLAGVTPGQVVLIVRASVQAAAAQAKQ